MAGALRFTATGLPTGGFSSKLKKGGNQKIIKAFAHFNSFVFVKPIFESGQHGKRCVILDLRNGDHTCPFLLGTSAGRYGSVASRCAEFAVAIGSSLAKKDMDGYTVIR